MLQKKREGYFNKIELDYNSPLKRFQKAIIYDAICYLKDKDSIWKNGNAGFGRDTQSQRPTLFEDKDELYRIKEYMWYNRYELPQDWQSILRTEYPDIKFINYPNMANEVHIDSENVE